MRYLLILLIPSLGLSATPNGCGSKDSKVYGCTATATAHVSITVIQPTNVSDKGVITGANYPHSTVNNVVVFE